jgi:plastocyanin
VNRDVRERILIPAALPAAVIVFIGALVFAFSRLLLAVTKEAAVGLGMTMALAILVVAAFLANRGPMRGSQRLSLILAAVMLVAGGSVTAASLGIRPIKPHEGPADATLVAKGIAWDVEEITLPTGRKVAVKVENQDNGTPHNFALYTGPDAKQSLFQGQVFSGVADRTYEFEAPKPGAYFFRCDVHPDVMTGAVTVR